MYVKTVCPLQYTASQCTASQCNASQCNASRYTTRQCIRWAPLLDYVHTLLPMLDPATHNKTHVKIKERKTHHIETHPHCLTRSITAMHCITLHYTATHCITLQHTAAHCNTLYHTATHCITLQHTLMPSSRLRCAHIVSPGVLCCLYAYTVLPRVLPLCTYTTSTLYVHVVLPVCIYSVAYMYM